MSRIFCKSPFYVSISGAANDTTDVELRIWNGTGSAPVDPTYTLSKPIPSTLITEVNYNISEYIKRYLYFIAYQNIHNINNASADTDQWCNVQVKRYKNGTLLGTDTYKAYYGYGYYSEGQNVDLGGFLMDEGTYYYHYDPQWAILDYQTTPLLRFGSITFEATNGYSVLYTNLNTGATSSVSLSATKVQEIYKVNLLYREDGNKVEFKDNLGNVLRTYYFRPVEACKYTPVVVDFVNRYGAFQREFFTGASRTSQNVQSSQYQFMQNPDFYTTVGQFQEFNKNGKETISTNTGWLPEEYSEVIRQLMLSERVLVNGRPAKVVTQNTELYEHINEKLINYKIDFEFAHYTQTNV